jgi:hypothetical protein
VSGLFAGVYGKGKQIELQASCEIHLRRLFAVLKMAHFFVIEKISGE